MDEKSTIRSIGNTVNVILQSFDRYHCAKLVMDSLVFFDEPAMNRMSVAICSILAAKISTCETSSLGAEPMYMKRLLRIVKAKVREATMHSDTIEPKLWR